MGKLMVMVMKTPRSKAKNEDIRVRGGGVGEGPEFKGVTASLTVDLS